MVAEWSGFLRSLARREVVHHSAIDRLLWYLSIYMKYTKFVETRSKTRTSERKLCVRGTLYLVSGNRFISSKETNFSPKLIGISEKRAYD